MEIEYEDIKQFLFPFSEREKLQPDFSVSNTLHYKPIILYEDYYYVFFPSSISVAIRHAIIQFCINSGLEESLEKTLSGSFMNMFQNEIKIFNSNNNPIFYPSYHEKKLINYNLCKEIDTGRFLHLLFIFDDFKNYEPKYLEGSSAHFIQYENYLEKEIESTQIQMQKQSNFKEGMSIIICCGWGRSSGYSIPDKESSVWSIETLSVDDLSILSQIPSMNELKFWRFIVAKKNVEKKGIHLDSSAEGLLALYGYAKSNNFNLIPHDQISDELTPDTLNLLSIYLSSDYALNLKEEIYIKKDKHSVQLPNGETIFMIRLVSDSYFQEDKFSPIYYSLSHLYQKELLSIIYGSRLKIWNRCKSSDNEESRELNYRIWDGISYWINRLLKFSEKLLQNNSFNEIYWVWEIEDRVQDLNLDSNNPSYQKLKTYIKTTSEKKKNILLINTIFSKGFLRGFYSTDNRGEKSMIYTLISEILVATKNWQFDNEEVDKIVDDVFMGDDAKFVHIFIAKDVRGQSKDKLPKPIFLDEIDISNAKIGLGWLKLKKTEIGEFNDVDSCCNFLNNLIDGILDKLYAIVRKFCKITTIELLVQNNEALKADEDHWRRTFNASRAIHDNMENIYTISSKEVSKRISSALATRIAIEISICECQKSGNKIPGILDISEIMTYSMLLFEIGNLSDVIQYGMMPAEIKVSPAGDIMYNHTFYDSISQPFGMFSQGVLLDQDAKNYVKYFEEEQLVKKIDGKIDKDFQKAWISEYGFTIDDGRFFRDLLEQEAIKKDVLFYEMTGENLKTLVQRGGSNDNAFNYFLDTLVLEERSKWENIPQKFSKKDIYPWLYKRKLSLVSRPIIKIENKYIIAPEMIREGFHYLIRNAYDGTFDANNYQNDDMKKWVGKKKNLSGHNFNKIVAKEFVKYGWNAKSDIKLTEILNMKLDRDYGDIDVLAWHKIKKQVLLIECKKLEFTKTPSENAKQISEFKGVKKKNEKLDRLLKHLERIKIIDENLDQFVKYTGMHLDRVPCLLFSRKVPLMYSDLPNLQKVKILKFDDIKYL